jgi:hypothetical protein
MKVKSEIRNPKSETNPKLEARRLRWGGRLASFVLPVSQPMHRHATERGVHAASRLNGTSSRLYTWPSFADPVKRRERRAPGLADLGEGLPSFGFQISRFGFLFQTWSHAKN